MRTSCRLPILCILLLLVTACARQPRPEPLAPQIGLGPRTQKPMAADPLSGADQPGALYDEARSDQPDVRGGRVDRDPVPPAPVQELSRTVQDNVTAPGERSGTQANGGGAAAAATATAPANAARPTTRAAGVSTGPTTLGASSGQYMTIGGVVAEVNGTPIYANKVLALVEPVLAARAKELDARQFRTVAGNEIRQQMMALRNLELEYAAAERNLQQKDKDLADVLTMQWKQRQITAAGGSLEIARRRAAERGDDFEELAKQQYRVVMSQIYYQKKIIPRIQVTAADMRQYYDRNRDRLFNDRGSARFRLIKIDVAKARGREPALDKITGVRNRIVKAGQSFDAIARSVNDDPRWLRSGGDLGGPIEQGAFAIEQVEQAVWATPPGEVTQVIDAGNAFYLAKVEERKPGNVKPFEDESVQAKIQEDLRAEQFRTLRAQVQEQLVKDAVIRSDAEMMNTALEMAMQNYSRWSGK